MYVVLCCDVLNRLRPKGHPMFLECTVYFDVLLAVLKEIPQIHVTFVKVNNCCDIVKKWHFGIGTYVI